jgi:hypothetical protein
MSETTDSTTFNSLGKALDHLAEREKDMAEKMESYNKGFQESEAAKSLALYSKNFQELTGYDPQHRCSALDVVKLFYKFREGLKE